MNIDTYNEIVKTRKAMQYFHYKANMAGGQTEYQYCMDSIKKLDSHIDKIKQMD